MGDFLIVLATALQVYALRQGVTIECAALNLMAYGFALFMWGYNK